MRWIEALPEEVAAEDWLLCFAATLVMAHAGELEEAEQWLELAAHAPALVRKGTRVAVPRGALVTLETGGRDPCLPTGRFRPSGSAAADGLFDHARAAAAVAAGAAGAGVRGGVPGPRRHLVPGFSSGSA